MSLDPFEILIDIERSCRSQSKSIPHKRESGQVWQGIGFITANKHFLSPLTEIKEVLTTPRITPLPAAAPWFLGVANLRGHVLPVTDLEAFLFGTRHTLSTASRVLVVNFEKTGVGFLVQQVLGVQRLLNKTMKTIIEEEMVEGVKEHLQGEFIDGLTQWFVLSLQSLSQTAQFYHVVREAGA